MRTQLIHHHSSLPVSSSSRSNSAILSFGVTLGTEFPPHYFDVVSEPLADGSEVIERLCLLSPVTLLLVVPVRIEFTDQLSEVRNGDVRRNPDDVATLAGPAPSWQLEQLGVDPVLDLRHHLVSWQVGDDDAAAGR